MYFNIMSFINSLFTNDLDPLFSFLIVLMDLLIVFLLSILLSFLDLKKPTLLYQLLFFTDIIDKIFPCFIYKRVLLRINHCNYFKLLYH